MKEMQFYHCVRLKGMPGDVGFANVLAEDDRAAFVKCVMVAKKNNWFGADSEPGFIPF